MSSNEPSQAPDSWKPVLLRALIAAGYGALTIFWQEPDTRIMAVTGALYLAGTGAAIFWLQAVVARHEAVMTAGPPKLVRPLQLTALLLLAAGLGVLFQGPGGFAVVAAMGLGAAGVLELYLGIRRRAMLISRDWRITGVVNIGAGLVLACLPAFTAAEPHAIMGVLGGSAIIVAVVLILAALSLYSEAPLRPVHRARP